MTAAALPTALLLAVLCVLALGVGVIMLIVFAQVTGWRALAKKFPAPGPTAAKRASSDGVVLGAWGWNAPPLRVALDDYGVWLFPRPPFTVAFANVRLPWESILAVGARAFMLFEVVEVRYGDGPKARIGFIAGTTANEVARRAAERGALPLPIEEPA